MTDPELLARLKQDGEDALEWLFREHYALVCQSVLRIIPDENTAEDIAQEVFLDIWRKRRELDIHSSFKAYLRRAAANKSLNFLRDQKIRWKDEEWMPEAEAQLLPPTDALESEDLQREIDLAIDRLPDRCRVVFVLSRFEEMSYDEIARELNISVKTVENQISKALKILRQAMGPYLG